MAALPSNSTSFVRYDDHTRAHRGTTVPQLSLLTFWAAAAALWAMGRARKANLLRRLLPAPPEPRHDDRATAEDCTLTTLLENGSSQFDVASYPTKVDIETGAGQRAEIRDTYSQRPDSESSPNNDGGAPLVSSGEVSLAVPKQNFSAVIPPPSVEQFLRQVIKLGVIMIYFYSCDYRKIWPLEERVYKRDTFLFVVFIFFLVGCLSTLRTTSDKVLNRDQTEEWKGWMQVMFVWYHYFAAKEWYNWIRVYIACYVWMTGFGNFSFFWVRGDFSAWRATKMLFRLDFLVIVVCLTVSNAYMVYYICAMHTYWFLSVYALMGVFRSWNEDRLRMAVKLVVYAVANAVIFDVPLVARTVFRPLSFVLGLADNPSDDLHEWLFRAGLDHWACFVGMFCAYNHPHWDAVLRFLEGEFNSHRYFGLVGRGDLVKMAVLVVLWTVFCAWALLVLPLEKYRYNRLHPYTSWIPISVYVITRNLWPALRVRYVYLFAWLGKITLETYLSQLHIYLQSNAKHLIAYVAGYPFMNFSLATVIYLTASFHLFHVTTEFSAFLLPTDRKLMLRNVAVVIAGLTLSTAFAFYLRLSGML